MSQREFNLHFNSDAEDPSVSVRSKEAFVGFNELIHVIEYSAYKNLVDLAYEEAKIIRKYKDNQLILVQALEDVQKEFYAPFGPSQKIGDIADKALKRLSDSCISEDLTCPICEHDVCEPDCDAYEDGY